MKSYPLYYVHPKQYADLKRIYGGTVPTWIGVTKSMPLGKLLSKGSK